MSAQQFRQEVAGLTRDEVAERVLEVLRELSLSIDSDGFRLRLKPLYGGCWGYGVCQLASLARFSGGLDAVSYFVLDAGSRFVLGTGETKAEALEQGRMVLATFGPRLQREYAQHVQAVLASRRAKEEERQAAMLARRGAVAEKVKSIPRRRRQIFEESQGKCHYCQTVLTLDGKWHIEHKMPRALGGGSEPGNLVASCVPCNMKKRDRTDAEFIAAQKVAA